MFYADFVLSKKGPLARIWLAAHWDKKLTKTQIFETNIESSIERILKPKVKLALRTSGHLMLGVVRIYSRKTKYLLADCNEAFVKIKMAFRPGMVDLPEDHREAAVNAVTLPEVFHDFDSVMPDLNNVDIEAQFTLNQSRVGDITIVEEYDNNFEQSDETAEGFNSGFEDDYKDDNVAPMSSFFDNTDIVSRERDSPVGLFEDPVSEKQVFNDPSPVEDVLPSTSSKTPEHIAVPMNVGNDDDDDDHFDVGCLSPDRSSVQVFSPIQSTEDVAGSSNIHPTDQLFPHVDNVPQVAEITPPDNVVAPIETNDEVPEVAENQAEQITLLNNEDESFALAPVDASALKGSTKAKRKRKLIVDEIKNISGDEMKAQLSDTTDVVITLDLAPPTKRLMHWKETGGVEKLFALPGITIPSASLFNNYQCHLVSISVPSEEIDEREREHIDIVDRSNVESESNNRPTPIPGKRGRKRKQPVVEEPEPEPAVLLPPPTPTLENPTKKLCESPHPVESNETAQSLPIQDESTLDIEMPILEPPLIEPVPAGGNDVLNQDEIPILPPPPQSEDIAPVVSTNNTDIFQTLLPEPTQGENNYDQMENMGYDGPDQEYQTFNEPNTPNMNAGGITPWHEPEYENPVSVEPQDERGDDETVEQFEERILNKRAAQLYSTLRPKISLDTSITFDTLIGGNQKKQVAQKFYSLLVLKKYRVLELVQEGPYAPISLSRGPKFNDPNL